MIVNKSTSASPALPMRRTTRRTTTSPSLAPAARVVRLASLEPLPSLFFLGEKVLLALFLLPPQLIFGFYGTDFWLLQVLVVDPLGMGAVLAGYDIISIGRAGSTVGTKAGEVVWA